MTAEGDADVELANRGDAKEGDVKDKEGEVGSSEELDDDLPERKKHDLHVPMFVFLWTYKPWHLWGHLVTLFLTHACFISACGVFACNYGMEELACVYLGLCGFVSCIIACSKLQQYGLLSDASEQMQEEMARMQVLMGKYATENSLLEKTLESLQQQCTELEGETHRLEKCAGVLELTTQDFENGVKHFKKERNRLESTFNNIDKIVQSLGDKETNLQKRCLLLCNELKKLRAHNKAMAEMYQNLVEENDKVNNTNARLEEQIERFENMNKKFVDQQDVLKDSMHGNVVGLKVMMENYEILFLQEIAHNTEFMDGQEGMTEKKFMEFMRRVPANMQFSESRLIAMFEDLTDENQVCDHEAMHEIIKQIVKSNTGVAGALAGIEGSVEPSAVVDL